MDEVKKEEDEMPRWAELSRNTDENIKRVFSGTVKA